MLHGRTYPSASKAKNIRGEREPPLASISIYPISSSRYSVRAVYAFLEEDASAPLTAFAPERSSQVDSLSEQIAPGLTLEIVAAPPNFIDLIAGALAAGAAGASSFATEACLRWLVDETVATFGKAKREDAMRRQQIARQIFDSNSAESVPDRVGLP